MTPEDEAPVDIMDVFTAPIEVFAVPMDVDRVVSEEAAAISGDPAAELVAAPVLPVLVAVFEELAQLVERPKATAAATNTPRLTISPFIRNCVHRG